MAKSVKSWMPKGKAAGGSTASGRSAGTGAVAGKTATTTSTKTTEGTRSAVTGRFSTAKTAAASPLTTVKEGSKFAKSSPSSRYSLRDGTVLTSVRKDVLDRALGRGEFSKK